MGKNRIQIYVTEPGRTCTWADEDGVTCGRSAQVHPVPDSTFFHKFEAGLPRFVYPSGAQRRKIYEQLKEEFDAV